MKVKLPIVDGNEIQPSDSNRLTLEELLEEVRKVRPPEPSNEPHTRSLFFQVTHMGTLLDGIGRSKQSKSPEERTFDL